MVARLDQRCASALTRAPAEANDSYGRGSVLACQARASLAPLDRFIDHGLAVGSQGSGDDVHGRAHAPLGSCAAAHVGSSPEGLERAFSRLFNDAMESRACVRYAVRVVAQGTSQRVARSARRKFVCAAGSLGGLKGCGPELSAADPRVTCKELSAVADVSRERPEGPGENDGLRWPRGDGSKWLHLASVVVSG